MSRPTEKAYQYIRKNILNGTYQPSTNLIESELAEKVHVSRSTVKKALMMLEKDNLVEFKTNKGATVKSLTLQEIINHLEIREALESIVAKSAVENINENNLQQLETILKKMKKSLSEYQFDEYSALNQEFHNIIYATSTNAQAVELIKTIKIQLNRIQLKTILIPGRTIESFNEHEYIYKALKSRDEDEVVKVIRKHVSNVSKVIKQNYKLLV